MTTFTNLATQRVAAKGAAVRSIYKFARPANVTAYTAGDVIYASTDVGVLKFDAAGVSGFIHDATVVMGETDTANLELLIFDQEPTNLADNAPLALVAADIDHLVGVFEFANTGKVNIGTNIEAYVATAQGHRAYTSKDGSLFGVLVTRSGYAPISAAQFSVTLHLEAAE